MSDGTKIEWTDATWNPVTGCSVVSPGCTNCYAMRLAGTRLREHESRKGLTIETKAGPVWTGEVRENWQWMEQPLSWTRPRRVFVAAHGDLFHDGLPDETIATIFGVMIAAHHLRGHIFQVLTKRSARMRALLTDDDFWRKAMATANVYILDRVDPLDRRRDDARATCDDYHACNPPPGIWLGVSAEDQRRFDERVADLSIAPAVVRWFSFEPLLGPIDCKGPLSTGRFHWAVVGGEDGPRPMHPQWARDIRDQCAAAGVPFFFKQWGRFGPEGLCSEKYIVRRDGSTSAMPTPNGIGHHRPQNGSVFMYRVGKRRAGRLLDGVTHDAFPKVPA